MSSSIVTVLLWTAALSSSVMAGIYFAFSTFIMRAFGNLAPSHSIAAMNSINTTIIRSLFMPLFFGSTIISMLLIVVALIYWSEPGSGLTMLAGAVYLVGMFGCTVVFNVPLNNSLAALDPSNTHAHPVWSHYLTAWTNWNHLRTVSSLATCVLCVLALSSH